MKKKHLLALICAGIASSVTMISCNKDDDQPLPEKVQKLIKADWKINSITVPSQENPAEDSSLLKDCMADDIIKFTLAGYDFQDGTNKCDSSIFPYNKGAWNYSSVTDSLLLGTSNANKIVRWKIADVTDTTLRIKWYDSISPTNKHVKTIFFKH